MTRHLDDLSDAELLACAREGDTPAYGVLWKRHWHAARAMAASVTGRFEPDDLASEAFARILKAVEKGNGPKSGFRSYLATTVRNVAIDWSRRKSSPNIEDPDVIEDWTYSELTALDRIDRQTVAQAFYDLPDSWQEVLWYTEVEDMAPREVAPILGLTPNAVSALAVRAREGLRQAWINAHLAESPHDDPAHSWTLKKLGPYVRGKLSKADHRRVNEHLDRCTACSNAAGEADRVGSRLALGILPLFLGVAGATAYAAWTSTHASSAVAAALPAGVSSARQAGRLRHLLTSTTSGSSGGMAAVAASVVAAAVLTTGAVMAAPSAEPAAASADAATARQTTDGPSRAAGTPTAGDPSGAEEPAPPAPGAEPQEPPALVPPASAERPAPPVSTPIPEAGEPITTAMESVVPLAPDPETPLTDGGPAAPDGPAEVPPTVSPGAPPADMPPAAGCEAALRAIPAADTVFAYRLDDPVGSTSAADLVHGGTASYAEPRTATGWTLSDGVLREPTDDFSIQIWFQATSGGGRLIGFSSTTQGLSSNYDRHLFLTDDGRVEFGVFPGVVHTISSPGSYTDGTWHQATATLSADGMALYVDGEQVASDPAVTHAQVFSGFWRIGFDNLDNWGPDTPSRRTVDGSLGYAAVYGTALTAGQVQDQWNRCG